MSDLAQRAARIAQLAAKATPGSWSRNIPPASKYPTIFAGRNTHVCAVTPSNKQVEGNCDLIAAVPEMAQLIADQAARIAELERDAARLTHLEDEDLQVRVEAVYFGTDDADPKWVILDFDGDPIAESEHGLREAIDAAMRGSVDAND